MGLLILALKSSFPGPWSLPVSLFGESGDNSGLTSSTDLTTQVVRHCMRDGSFCFRSITGEVVQAEKLEFC